MAVLKYRKDGTTYSVYPKTDSSDFKLKLYYNGTTYGIPVGSTSIDWCDGPRVVIDDTTQALGTAPYSYIEDFEEIPEWTGDFGRTGAYKESGTYGFGLSYTGEGSQINWFSYKTDPINLNGISPNLRIWYRVYASTGMVMNSAFQMSQDPGFSSYVSLGGKTASSGATHTGVHSTSVEDYSGDWYLRVYARKNTSGWGSVSCYWDNIGIASS